MRGANEWVGRSRWNFGSFHLWGDVPTLMPIEVAIKNWGGSWFNVANNTMSGLVRNPVHALAGLKNARNRWSDGKGNLSATTSSKSPARARASAQIAKIPLPLARHIAKVYKP